MRKQAREVQGQPPETGDLTLLGLSYPFRPAWPHSQCAPHCLALSKAPRLLGLSCPVCEVKVVAQRLQLGRVVAGGLRWLLPFLLGSQG